MKTFHSIGTPIGNVDRMCRWNSTMMATAIQVTVWFGDPINTSGTVYSMNVPPWASRPANGPGRRSSGKCR